MKHAAPLPSAGLVVLGYFRSERLAWVLGIDVALIVTSVVLLIYVSSSLSKQVDRE